GKLRGAINEIKDNKLQISVYNEGEGIAAEDVPFIFERFYKGDKSRGLDKSGAGLGMFISKTIIDAHNENIWVRSEQGSFCEFNFTLALAEL
ncbi:MAG: sensor histidine kinase, partial [Clostridia bacterium]|nr:sensor histidine kinase [Clostridia bacterium]